MARCSLRSIYVMDKSISEGRAEAIPSGPQGQDADLLVLEEGQGLEPSYILVQYFPRPEHHMRLLSAWLTVESLSSVVFSSSDGGFSVAVICLKY